MGWIPLDSKTIRVEQGKYDALNPLHIGERVRLSSGEEGGIQEICVSNSLPRFLIQTETRLKWFGKTKIRCVFRTSQRM
jgi:hypothetical protein